MSASNQVVIPNNEDNVDRISELPDYLLSHILSFLPTRSAIATCILSQRWRYVWTRLLILDFNDLPSSMTNLDNIVFTKEQRARFEKYVNRVLLLSNRLFLKKLHFVMYDCFAISRIYEWMSVIAKLQVQDLCCINRNVLVGVPSYIFSDKFMLLVLNLEGFQLFLPPLFHLPSLRRFTLIKGELTSEYDTDSKVDPWMTFISNCPVLEELIIGYCEGIEKLPVCSNSIKTLRVFLHKDPKRTIIIETPNLEILELSIGITESTKVNDLPSLNEASLHVSTSRIRWVKLLQKISCTKSLFLYEIILDGPSANIRLPIFQNLTHLDVGYTSWPIVLEIIKKAPKLVAFVINRLMFDWPDKKPRKMEFPFERIEYYGFVSKECYKMIRYFLSNSGLLKEFKFCMHKSLGVTTQNEILTKLLKIPRASNQCKIIVVNEGCSSISEDNDSESERSADNDSEAEEGSVDIDNKSEGSADPSLAVEVSVDSQS